LKKYPISFKQHRRRAIGQASYKIKANSKAR